MPQETIDRQEEFAALIGIDWADQEHHVCMRVVGSNASTSRKLLQKPEEIAEWIAGLRSQFPGQRVAVAIEQSRGGSSLRADAIRLPDPVSHQSGDGRQVPAGIHAQSGQG